MSKTAWLFPGQGAQVVGMARDLTAQIPSCRSLFDRASSVLGYDLASICFDGPIERLTVSAHAQPAIFVASLACLEAVRGRKTDLSFDYLAGLSSGEWTALHLAGVVSFEDTLHILEARGRLMQTACEARPGSMMSVIGAAPDALAAVCEKSGAEQANLNSHEQTVLSGSREAIDRAEQVARELGIRKLIRLNVAGAFHSSLMREAAAALEPTLVKIPFKDPSIPVVANVTARPHADAKSIAGVMIRQIYSPVNWVGSIEWLKAQGVTTYVECGPGKVLTGLVRRIDNEARLLNISDLSTLDQSIAKWSESINQG